jgi:putative phosphoribosyl transferase
MDTSTRAETQSVTIPLPASGAVLHGDLTLPSGSRGMVLFAHGSGSSRMSPRNRMVAARLQDAGFATLLVDLLPAHEANLDEMTGQYRFDIGLLAERLTAVTQWLRAQPAARGLPLGYFGASTGAAAALVASARQPGVIGAIVSRGGRPDLAGAMLRRVTAPTLLIVGGSDEAVMRLNRSALGELAASHKELLTVAGATHLFEEPGALERVAELARAWFARYLRQPEGAGKST